MKNRMAVALAASLLLAGCGGGMAPMSSATPTGLATAFGSAPLLGRLLVNGASGGMLTPGASAKLTLDVQQNGRRLMRFSQDDTKYMHLVIVSGDLQTFAHVHPVLQPDGSFAIVLNAPASDFDNQMVTHAVPKPGPYMLFADVTPAGQSTQLVRYSAQAAGASVPVPLVLDPIRPDGTIQKFFDAAGEPGRPGDAYRVTLTIGQLSGHMPMVNLACHIEALQPNGQYAPVTDLQSWLGMPGHAILVSQNGQSTDDKVFLHLHAGMDGPMAAKDMGPMKPITGPDLNFMAMGQERPPAGVYKMWVQTERRGRGLTLPFVFRLS